MPPDSPEYDVFLSYATEDRVWCENLATLLRDRGGVRVWFDEWEMQGGDLLPVKLNDGLKNSRKMISVWSKNYFRDGKVWTLAEIFSRQHSDPLSKRRLLIPVLIDNKDEIDIPPLFSGILDIDFRNKDDFDLRFRELIASLDLPQRQSHEERLEYPKPEAKFLESEMLPEYGRDKNFEIEVAELYRLLGYEPTWDAPIEGGMINLSLKKREGGALTQIILECTEKRIAARERESILKRYRSLHERLKRHQWIAVSALGFDLDSQSALEEAGITCMTYSELLGELAPLDKYVNGLISEYEKWKKENWDDEDRFIRPNLLTDIVYNKRAALAHIAEWLDDPRAKQLVVLGDLGTGKTRLASFIANDLAENFIKDPLRHPAPVLIPLKEVRKKVDLESIVAAHFKLRGSPIADFERYEYLIKKGKVITIFDEFDEMADRVKWEVTRDNYRQLAKVSQLNGKFILTCRTHYFKDRTEQVKLIGEGPHLSEVETEIYKELRRQPGAEVVYLQEFDEKQILAYLGKVRPDNVDEDWKKIQEIHNLRELANRPLLLDMIVKSLSKLEEKQEINAANLYNVYTNIWVEREKGKERLLNEKTRLELMLELAWTMWREEKSAIHYNDLVPFVKKLVSDKAMDFGDEKAEDITGEMQLATFLKRDDHGNFSFAYRSFMQYFLARKIQKSITDNNKLIQILNARRFDQKIVFFLTLLDVSDAVREPLQRILAADYSCNVSENALQILYWSGRIRCRMEEKIEDVGKLRKALAERIPAGAQLAGVNLQEITLEAADLTDANLSKADLTKANLNNALLLRSDLSEAVLTEARFENLSAVAVDFRRADLSKASFIGASINNCDFTDAIYEREAFVSAANLENNHGMKETRHRDLIFPVVQLGHASGVNAVAYSPDGKLTASGSNDGLIHLYRVADGKLLCVLEGHQGRAWSVAFSSDGKMIASASNDKSIKLWDVASGSLIRSFQGHQSSVHSIAFSPDGKMIASASNDKSIKLWDVASGSLIRSFQGHQGNVNSAAFSPDGKTIASGSYDKSVRLWDVASGSLIRSFQGHQGNVNSAAFSPDGKTIASGSFDASVRLWDVASGSLIRSFRGHQSYVWSVVFSPDGKTIASGSFDASVRLWDVASGSLIRSFRGHQSYVWSVVFSPDGKTIASGSFDASVRLWDVKAGYLIGSFQEHLPAVNSVALSADGKLIVSGSSDNNIKLWNVKTGFLIRSLKGHTHTVNSVALSPDGKSIASASNDTSIRLWDTESGSLIHFFQGHQGFVWSVAFSPDGKLIATGDHAASVRLWDVVSGSLIRTLKEHWGFISSVAFSPDSKLIATGSSDTIVRLCDVETGSLIRSLKGHKHWVMSVAFSPDGRLIASAGEDTIVRLCDVETGSLICSLKEHWGYVKSVTFSPDGKLIASGSQDTNVKLWDVETGSLIRTLEGHMGPVYTVKFSLNGKYLVAAGSAGRLQFWDVEKGEAFLYLYSFGPGAWLALLPDGRFDASPEGMRYLCYTEIGTLYSYTAEELQKEFYSPDAVRQALSIFNQ